MLVTAGTAASRSAHSGMTTAIARHAAVRFLAVALAAIAGLILLASLIAGQLGTVAGDVNVYWTAAERLRAGQNPFVESIPQVAYRYSPWFAMAWVPVTYLPRHAVETAWVGLQLAAVVYLVRPFWRKPAVLLVGPALLYAAMVGNVHPLMLAGLAYGVPRRSGPLFIALAASLKAVPILYVLWYLGRREWGKAALACALTVLLVAPMLAFDLSAYASAPGHTLSLAGRLPLAWILVAAATSVGALALARTRYGLLASSVAILAALPRLLLYDIGYLAVPLRPSADDVGVERAATDAVAAGRPSARVLDLERQPR